MLEKGKRRIYDADGDGVEDNVHTPHDELDKFYLPAVHGVASEDIYNTHNGELPGHIQKYWDERESEPADHYSTVRRDWVRK